MAIPPAKKDPIAVVGAGIFGLSTALHLAHRGYTNVTVFDKQPYHETHYSYLDGCDAASAGKTLLFPFPEPVSGAGLTGHKTSTRSSDLRTARRPSIKTS